MQLDPGRTGYDLHFRLLGVAVRVHPFFWLATFLMGFSGGDPKSILVWMLASFVSILAHEMGHALTMRRYGLGARVVLYHFGGLAIAEETDHPDWLPRSRESTWQAVLISFAGPAAGFLLAGLLAVILLSSGGTFQWLPLNVESPIFWKFHLPKSIPEVVQAVEGKIELTPLRLLCEDLFYINIFWGLVNLLPVFPLDGGQIARALFTARDRYRGLSYALQLSCVTAVVVGLLAYFVLQNQYMGFMFFILAFSNYQMWQQANRPY